MALIPTQATLTIGGRTFTDLKNLIVIRGYVGGASSSYGTARKYSGTAGYTPSGSKKFRALALKMNVGAAGDLYIGYTDDDLGVTSSSAGTNRVFPGGDVNLGSMVSGTEIDPGALGKLVERPLDFLMPNGKYFQVAGNASALAASVDIYGYEED